MFTDLSLGFALGLAGSLHCVQMCGPLVAAMGAPQRGTRARSAVASGAYHAGRVLTYTLLGTVGGLFGQSLSLMTGWQQAAAILAGLLMIVAGVLMFGRFENPSFVQIAPAGSFTRTVSRLFASTCPQTRFLTGMLLGLLPCGMIYAALLKALGTGDALRGAVTMLGFGVATSLPLLGLSMLSDSWIRSISAYGTKLTACAVVVMGIALIWRGMIPVTLASQLHHH